MDLNQLLKIPKKSAHSFIFVSNINDPLAGEMNPYPELMEAFLLSETYSTPKTISLAKKAHASGSLIVSDNGNFSRMKKIAEIFQEKGTELLTKAQKDISINRKIQEETLHEYKSLILKIKESVKAEQNKVDISKITGRQLKCMPDYMIGMEDLTIPVMHMCNVFHPVFRPSAKMISSFQKNTQKIYHEQERGTFGFENELKKILKFMVYHAYNYESARQVSLINKNTNPDGIAISFGATLASRNYIPSIKIEKKIYKFNETLPESYFLSIALILGCISNNKTNLPVHILGVGTPILIALMASLLKKSKAVSFDSTSTFKDADDGNIYASRNAFLKMDMYKVAAYALVNDEPYHSSSPWFSWFDTQFPSDWKGLQAKLKVKPGDDISTLAKTLKSRPKLLEKYIPFFSPMRAGNDIFIKKVRIARTGGNYWVLKNICEKVRKHKKNSNELINWVESEVKRYEQFASPKWAVTVRTCFEIIKNQLH